MIIDTNNNNNTYHVLSVSPGPGPSSRPLSQQLRETGGDISIGQVSHSFLCSFIHSLTHSLFREHLLSLFYVLGPALVPQRI